MSDNSLLEQVAAVVEDSHLTLEFAAGRLWSNECQKPFSAHKRSDNFGSGVNTRKRQNYLLEP